MIRSWSSLNFSRWIAVLFGVLLMPVLAAIEPSEDGPDEMPDDPYITVPKAQQVTAPSPTVVRGRHRSIQVNVDSLGRNIVGDAANEPSMAIDPTNFDRMAIGWRQFDTILSNFRQAGYGHTADGGASWTSGVLDPGVFRSDPVLDFANDGTFYYNSLESDFTTDVFRSSDGGVTWSSPVYAFGGDKQWMSVDRTAGQGAGHLYTHWFPSIGCCSDRGFNRSTDDGATFEEPIAVGDGMRRGTLTVGPDGAVYMTGHSLTDRSVIRVAKSTTVADSGNALAVDFVVTTDLGGPLGHSAGPNPSGMLGQIWIVADPTDALRVFLLASIDPPGDDPLDVHFARSVDGGRTWSAPVRVNDDPTDNGTWQWFGSLSVAPNGRLDAVWNDTRDDPGGVDTVLRFAFSEDSGTTWSASEPLTPAWDPHLGFPQQNKIGDYYETISHNDAVHLAYAATFNGEQDVYYLPIRLPQLFEDDFETGDTLQWSGRVP